MKTRLLALMSFVILAPASAAAAPWSSGLCKVSRQVGSKTVTKPALCGVGKVSGVRNLSLARQTADSRARGDLLEVRRRYDQISTTNKLASDKLDSDRLLIGSTIERRWRDRRTGAMYSLAVLELDKLPSSRR